jgi:hypothetical protein
MEPPRKGLNQVLHELDVFFRISVLYSPNASRNILVTISERDIQTKNTSGQKVQKNEFRTSVRYSLKPAREKVFVLI